MIRSPTTLPEHQQIGAATRELLVVPTVCPELRALRIAACGISDAQSGFSFIRHAWEHSQLLVCHEGATTRALLTLADEVRDAVHARFGVTLEREPVLLGA